MAGWACWSLSDSDSDQLIRIYNITSAGRSIGGFGRRRLVALHIDWLVAGGWLGAGVFFCIFFFFCFVQVCLFGFNLFFYADIKSSNETNKLQHQEMAMWFDVRLTFSASVPGFFLSYFHSRSPSFHLGLFWFMELFFCLSVCLSSLLVGRASWLAGWLARLVLLWWWGFQVPLFGYLIHCCCYQLLAAVVAVSDVVIVFFLNVIASASTLYLTGRLICIVVPVWVLNICWRRTISTGVVYNEVAREIFSMRGFL